MRYEFHRGNAETRRKAKQPQIFADERRSKKLAANFANQHESNPELFAHFAFIRGWFFSAPPRLRGELVL
jgi:hypothetical protein